MFNGLDCLVALIIGACIMWLILQLAEMQRRL